MSRTRRLAAAGRRYGTVALALVVAAACSPAESDEAVLDTSPEPVTSPATTSPSVTDTPEGAATQSDPLPISTWRAREVIDGDTLVVDGPGGEITVRIVGINAPERGECFADEATAALRALVDGEELELLTDVSDVDQYGRALRFVETTGGTDVGAALVEDGLVIARRYEPDVGRSDRYQSLQESARTEGRGLWAPDACGTGTADPAAIFIEVNPDAPGDDNENLNGEWVRFTNDSDATIDLDGWQVADESATHRYVFAEGRLDPGGSITLYTGCGVGTDDSLYWCKSGSAVWNNGGDTVFLRDRDGNLAAVEGYGASVGS